MVCKMKYSVSSIHSNDRVTIKMHHQGATTRWQACTEQQPIRGRHRPFKDHLRFKITFTIFKFECTT